MTHTTNHPAPTAVKSDPDFLCFRDLDNHHTIVLHTGEQAKRDATARKIWQQAHNQAIGDDNPIDPEFEPDQALYVNPRHLDKDGVLYPMADADATKKIIVHVHGVLAAEKSKRLCAELMTQAPSAEICRGQQGKNAEPWSMVEMLRMEADIAAESETPRQTRLPLAKSFQGFDVQASYLIKGYLPTACAASIYGPSGSFKSFLAVSWACHVATGNPWDGRKVDQGAALYIVGEGGVGVPRRIRAWADEYNSGCDIPNLYRIDIPVFMADPAQVAELELAARQVKEETGLPVRLIVVDTVARCFGAGDENSARDMGGFIAGCDLIKARTGATVLMVHHSGKNEDNGARGSSAFRAALDAEFLVKRENPDSQAFTVVCTKMKDDEPPAKRAYNLKNHVVTYDSDGDEVTSLVVIDQGREPEESGELEDTGNLSANHKALFQVIRAACEKLDGPVKRAAIIEQMKSSGTWHPNNGSRWFKKLMDDGLIGFDAQEKTVWVIGGADE